MLQHTIHDTVSNQLIVDFGFPFTRELTKVMPLTGGQRKIGPQTLDLQFIRSLGSVPDLI